jgi:SAM-dependent methyltransferase
VLDVACGRGRHLHWFASRGHPVTGVDRSVEALQSLAGLVAPGPVELVQADIESGQWPLMQGDRPRQFGAVVVTNYLWRALMPVLVDSLAGGGVLLYETFADGNASVGKPSRPDFLLHRGELLQLCHGLRIVAFEDGFCDNPARFVQRIAAVRTRSPDAGPDCAAPGAPVRYPIGS